MARRRSDAVASFTDLYQRMVGDRPLVSGLLTGHLAVEFLLRRLVSRYDVRLPEHADSLRHHALILLNHQIGTIDEAQRDVLLAINALRNRLAHQISYEPNAAHISATSSSRAYLAEPKAPERSRPSRCAAPDQWPSSCSAVRCQLTGSK